MALTHQQTYLLDRLPKLYDLKKAVPEVEPAEVVRARKTIDSYVEKTKKHRVDLENKIKKAIASAREAIYFKPAEEALEIVKKIEQQFGR